MDNRDFTICEKQQELYKYAAKRGYDMREFSDLFLRSELCAESFDVPYSRFKINTPEEYMAYLKAEAGGLSKKSSAKEPDDYDVENAGFVGMIYRMLYIITGYTSRELSEKVPYSEVHKRFTCTLHETEDYIAEDICNALGLEYYADRVNLMI